MDQAVTHRFSLRVYYEDTDLAGIVYYANYLKFIERARSEWVRTLGVDQVAMKSDGVVFAVSRIEADYRVPAKFDDMIEVQTTLMRLTGTRIVLSQNVTRDATTLFESTVTLVCLAETGKPTRIPADIRAKIDAHK